MGEFLFMLYDVGWEAGLGRETDGEEGGCCGEKRGVNELTTKSYHVANEGVEKLQGKHNTHRETHTQSDERPGDEHPAANNSVSVKQTLPQVQQPPETKASS